MWEVSPAPKGANAWSARNPSSPYGPATSSWWEKGKGPESRKMNIFTLLDLARIASIFLLLMIHPSVSANSSSSDVTRLQELVTKFIVGEYGGEVDVRQYCSISNVRANDEPAGLVSLVGDPIIIVRSYSIGDILQHGNQAFVAVDFIVLGKTQGTGVPGRSIYQLSAQRESVHYNLRQTPQGWKFVDPPTPHVSIEALINHYQGEMQSMEELLVDRRLSTSQLQFYEAVKKNMNQLQRIRSGLVSSDRPQHKH